MPPTRPIVNRIIYLETRFDIFYDQLTTIKPNCYELHLPHLSVYHTLLKDQQHVKYLDNFRMLECVQLIMRV